MAPWAAIGALGVIMAFTLGGKPVYVDATRLRRAPVVNTFVALTLFKAWGTIGPIFVAGLILTAAGAVTVPSLRPAITRSLANRLSRQPRRHCRLKSSQSPSR